MKLVIEDEAGTRSVVPFATDELTVGRAAAGLSFRLPDRDVSRRHARFYRAGGATFVEDLGSLTGTYVNGERLHGKRKLREGDLVEIGAYDLVVVEEVEAVGAGAPPPLPALSPPPSRSAGAGPAAPPADPNAVTRRLPPRPGPGDRRAAALRRRVVVGAIAIALVLAAGWVLGVFAG